MTPRWKSPFLLLLPATPSFKALQGSLTSPRALREFVKNTIVFIDTYINWKGLALMIVSAKVNL